MASASDPIYILVSYHSRSPDGSTRNDTFYTTSTLNSYTAPLRANIATPIATAAAADTAGAGTLSGGQQYVTSGDSYTGTAGGGPISLRCEIGIGLQTYATPPRYHLVAQDVFVSTTTVLYAQDIYNWISNTLLRLTPVNLYQGVYFT